MGDDEMGPATGPAFSVTERRPVGEIDGNSALFDRFLLEWNRRLCAASQRHRFVLYTLEDLPLLCFLSACLIATFYPWGPEFVIAYWIIYR